FEAEHQTFIKVTLADPHQGGMKRAVRVHDSTAQGDERSRDVRELLALIVIRLGIFVAHAEIEGDLGMNSPGVIDVIVLNRPPKLAECQTGRYRHPRGIT